MDQEKIDRGDFIEPVEPAAPAAESVPEVKEPEAAPEVKPEVAEPAAEPARDAGGKFTKPAEPDDEKIIPTSRHKAVLETERQKRETVERELADLKQQVAQQSVSQEVAATDAEITALELEYSKLLLDGDHVKAAETMTAIRHKTTALSEQRSVGIAERVSEERTEKGRMSTAISELETAYPALQEANEAFDQDLTDMVLDQQLVFINRDRMTPSAALLKAAEKVMGKLGTPAVAEPTGLNAAKSAQDRKSAQVEKNLDAAKRQPASMKEAGVDSDKAGMTGGLDASRMTPEEMAALPAATRARLRGDFVS